MNSIGSGYVAAQSLGSSGYVKFSNGLIIQWGRYSVSTNGETTITYLTSFTSASSYVIMKNYGSSSGREAKDSEVSIYNKTATGATTFNAAADSDEFEFLAIGY